MLETITPETAVLRFTDPATGRTWQRRYLSSDVAAYLDAAKRQNIAVQRIYR